MALQHKKGRRLKCIDYKSNAFQMPSLLVQPSKI
jgi:hypothetical protein